MVADKSPDWRSVSLVFLEGAGKECPWCMVDVDEDLYVQDVASVIGGGTFRRFMRAVMDGDEKKAEQVRFRVVDLFFDQLCKRSVTGVSSAKDVAGECFDGADNDPEVVLRSPYVKRCAQVIARINKGYDEGWVVLASAEECAVCLADVVEEAIQEELNYYRDSEEEEDLRQDEDYQALLKLEKKARLRRSEIGVLPQAKKDDVSRGCLSDAEKGDGSDAGNRDEVPREGKARLSKLCVWSLICGVFSIPFSPLMIFQVLSVWFGIKGIMGCRREGRRGKWMGVAGIAVSCLSCVIFFIWLLSPDQNKVVFGDVAAPTEVVYSTTL